MRDGTHSRTAELTAAIRASHFLYDRPQIFSDPFALDLTSVTWRLICRNRLLHWYVIRRKYGHLRPVHGWILARSQIAETSLEAFVKRGGRQYVQIGAGFDSMSLRRPHWMKDVRMFEIDHPRTQAIKNQRMRNIKHPVVEKVEYIAVDLEKESIEQSLKRSAFDPNQEAFFSWLGVVYYLTASAIVSALNSIRRSSPRFSEVIFDFLVPEQHLNAVSRSVYDDTRSYTANLGEPYVSFQSTEDIHGLAESTGFEVLSVLPDEKINERCFSSRTDDLHAMRGCGIAHLRSIPFGGEIRNSANV